jgi:putative Holliday junction resolvase
MKQENNLKNFLGVDWGMKRIGLALGNNENRLALPYKTVADIGEVLEMIEEEKIDALILGRPLKMSNIDMKLDTGFENFLKALKERIEIPVILIDERLSSQGADALSGNKKTKAGRDALSAMLILQNYFDRELK